MRSIVFEKFVPGAILLALAAGCAEPADGDEPSVATSQSALIATPCQATTEIVVSDSTTFGANNGGLIRVDPVTGVRTTLSENNSPTGGVDFETPWSIVFDGSGQILVADAWQVGAVRNPGIVSVDPNTGVRTAISNNTTPSGGPTFVMPGSVAVEADGTLVVVDGDAFPAGNGGVILVDPATGARTTLSKNGAPTGPDFENPWDVLVAPSGDIYVLDAGDLSSTGKVLRVDPSTGARTLVSKNGAPAGGPSFAFPQGMTMDKDGTLLVSDGGAFAGGPGIMRIDPATGTRTTVSSNSSPASGPSFSTPGDLVVESCGGILITDHAMGAVYRVNAATGERSVISESSSPTGSPTFGYIYGIAAKAGLPPFNGPRGHGGSHTGGQDD